MHWNSLLLKFAWGWIGRRTADRRYILVRSQKGLALYWVATIMSAISLLPALTCDCQSNLLASIRLGSHCGSISPGWSHGWRLLSSDWRASDGFTAVVVECCPDVPQSLACWVRTRLHLEQIPVPQIWSLAPGPTEWNLITVLYVRGQQETTAPRWSGEDSSPSHSVGPDGIKDVWLQ